MNDAKKEFVQQRFIPLIRQIPSDTPARWGKMTVQQMIEHFADYTRIASGKTAYTEIVTPSENLDRMRAFLMSEKPFKENTPNPLMSEVPAPVRNPTVSEAVNELEKEINYFFSVFEENNLQVTRNPFFGDLNYEQNVQLLHKHALHHLKQFGVIIQPTESQE